MARGPMRGARGGPSSSAPPDAENGVFEDGKWWCKGTISHYVIMSIPFSARNRRRRYRNALGWNMDLD